jgi:hypothetical protein
MSLALPSTSTSTCPSDWKRCTKHIHNRCTYALGRYAYGISSIDAGRGFVKRPKTVSRSFRARLHKVKLTAHTAREHRFDLMRNNALRTSPTLSLLSTNPLTKTLLPF